MNPVMVHFQLFTETQRDRHPGRWRFVLRAVDGSQRFEADDIEPGVSGDRLELLTLVRALESLDQPSRVTLVGCSNNIRQGIQFGMPEWRESEWLWEWFGHMVPVKNADLWQRLDRLMAFHQIECRHRRIDGAHSQTPMPNYVTPRELFAPRISCVSKPWSVKAWERLPFSVRRRMSLVKTVLRHFMFDTVKKVRMVADHGLGAKGSW